MVAPFFPIEQDVTGKLTSVRIDDFIVDPGREEHIARHNVRLEEVDQVVFGRHAHDQLGGGFWSLVGRTDAGRMLTVIAAERGRHVYALVTARDADRSEGRLYFRRFPR